MAVLLLRCAAFFGLMDAGLGAMLSQDDGCALGRRSFLACRTSRPISDNGGDYTKKWGVRQGGKESIRGKDSILDIHGCG
ncbi:MAG: hypothetical protein COZ32_00755 [Nitrospirae bacterium CG_4_10_14_3_um_filter_53_41]|nr:MAG: hypothetical protein COW52_07360 [Nitrospirae bacterium CG17_big_fil_post_rev_8_21_14_2_50_50_9]PIW85702.1 MAG: hypothetical protein COZ95_03090 [Nitrospirae bacterium CG_4_8_14_3_um_filter_50_41]PIX86940.1 MAG: hypothetical protein COZ32_00755 [Nitrospirae bacterium CG_4_10_14_3_um_filter_53_41]